MRRLAVLALLAATLAGAPAAVAGPPCRSIVDVEGDAYYLTPNNPAKAPTSSALDILSADFATGPHNVVAAIRVKTLDPDAWTSGGAAYAIEWTSGGVTKSMTYRQYLDQDPDALYDADVHSGTPTDDVKVTFGVVRATGEILLSMPRRLDPALKARGAKIGGLHVVTYSAVNRKNSYSSSKFDDAGTARTYVDGSKTCLKGT